MSFDQSKWVWVDGRLVPWTEATFHLSAHALHYGSGVFEGIRCYQTDEGPALFQAGPHLARLRTSAEIYGLTINFDNSQLLQAIDDVILKNDLASCYVRPVAFFGSGGLLINPMACPTHVAILAFPWEKPLGRKVQETGLRITISPWVKFHSKMIPTTAKGCGQYLNSILAIRDAAQRGYDEALLLDAHGNISEGSAENIFIMCNGQLMTNDEQDSILPGVTRAAVIEMAQALGIPLTITRLQVKDLLSATEAFMTGTGVEIVPVCEVDDVRIGSGTPGPVTRKIQQTFAAITSNTNPAYQEWLHFVGSSKNLLVDSSV
jgi:branched-chain amino acid aminotransferase